MPLIITSLKGGLGNQLFQYACGQALARRWAVPLKLDISAYADGASRIYALEPYNLPVDLLDTRRALQLLQTPGALGCIGAWLTGQRAPRTISEAHFHYDPRPSEVPPPLLLDGYWQSERYFLNTRPVLSTELTIVLTGANATLSKEMRERNSVAVHVRRGDYLSNSSANLFHGVCEPEYYRRAAHAIEQQVGPVHYYLFSDDIEWAAQNLDFLRPAIVVNLNSPTEAHLDLELMRRCKHHIIANSTFSWWGAWLSDTTNKIVIAPSRWFLDASIDTRDLVPASWQRI